MVLNVEINHKSRNNHQLNHFEYYITSFYLFFVVCVCGYVTSQQGIELNIVRSWRSIMMEKIDTEKKREKKRERERVTEVNCWRSQVHWGQMGTLCASSSIEEINDHPITAFLLIKLSIPWKKKKLNFDKLLLEYLKRWLNCDNSVFLLIVIQINYPNPNINDNYHDKLYEYWILRNIFDHYDSVLVSINELTSNKTADKHLLSIIVVNEYTN